MIVYFVAAEQELLTLSKGLTFFSKDHENGRNKKINDHKYHHDDTGEDQEGTEWLTVEFVPHKQAICYM